MSYGAACHFGLKYGSCRAISRAADSNCCEDRWCFEYEHQAAQGLYTSASATAARPDMYRDCTWLCPLCVPSGESTREPEFLAHLICRGVVRLAKAQQHRQYKLQRCKPSPEGNRSLVQVRRSMRSILRVQPQQCEIQLYFYSCPRAQHSWQNTWVTSDRMIHSPRGKKSGFSWVFPRK